MRESPQQRQLEEKLTIPSSRLVGMPVTLKNRARAFDNDGMGNSSVTTCPPSGSDDHGPPDPERESWDEHFYRMAELISERSKDKRKVGAVIVGQENIVLSTGYNGLPRGVEDYPERLSDDEKLKWTVHAERNAIYNAARVGTAINGGTIYTTLFPCSTCAGAIVQAGIRRVVTFSKRGMWKKDPCGDDGRRALRILMEAGVAVLAPYIDIGELPPSDDIDSAFDSAGPDPRTPAE